MVFQAGLKVFEQVTWSEFAIGDANRGEKTVANNLTLTTIFLVVKYLEYPYGCDRDRRLPMFKKFSRGHVKLEDSLFGSTGGRFVLQANLFKHFQHSLTLQFVVLRKLRRWKVSNLPSITAMFLKAFKKSDVASE